MKIKRFGIVRLTFVCESAHPIVARLIILSRMHKLIKFRKIRLEIQPEFISKEIRKPFYRLYVPKIRYIKGGDA